MGWRHGTKSQTESTTTDWAYATGAFLADLLRSRNADKTNGWVYRSLKKASFKGEAVAWRTFEQLFKGLQGLGFLDHVPGHKVADDPYDDRTQYAARFRATPALLKFCVDHHVEPTKWSEHFLFKYDLPEHPVDLRARKPKDYLGRSIVPTGTPMEFERTNKVAKIEDAVRELNEFFDKQILRGGEHHGNIRIFSNGDDSDFDWNKGAVIQPAYEEQLPAHDRRPTQSDDHQR